MQFLYTFLLLVLSTFVTAAPVDRRWWGGWSRPGFTTISWLDFGKRTPYPLPVAPNTQAASCSMTDAYNNMPAASPALPPPTAGLSLSHVAVGRGTQNYTCDLSNSTAVPVALGAVATLFNVTCLAADSPALLAQLPAIAMQLPQPDSIDEAGPAYQDLSGHHYFLDLTTAFFNLDTTAHTYGTGAFKKVNASAAPAGSPTGQNAQGYGSVPWLKLVAKSGSTGQVFQEVYRLNTAGGNPPTTCTGQQAAFEVAYAAEYWLFV